MMSFHIIRRLRSARVGVLAATSCCLLSLLVAITMASEPVPLVSPWLDDTPKPSWWVMVLELPDADLNRGRHPSAISGMTVDPHGKWIATCGGEEPIVFWDPATLKEIERIETKSFGPIPEPETVAVSHDGKVLAATIKDAKCHIWRNNDGKWKHIGAIDQDGFNYQHDLAFLPKCDRLAISTAKPAVEVWDVASQPFKQLGEVRIPPNDLPSRDPDRYVISMAFDPRAEYLFTLLDGGGACLVWDLRKQPWSLIQTVPPCQTRYSLAVSADGGLLAVGPARDNCKDLYSIKNGHLEPVERKDWPKMGGIVRFSPDGSMIATIRDGSVIDVHSLKNTGQQKWRIDYRGRQMLTAIEFVPTRKAVVVATFNYDHRNDIDVWDLSAERPVSLRATLAQKEKEKAEPKK